MSENTSTGSPVASPPGWRGVFARRLTAFLVMLIVAMVYCPQRLGDWDAWDYAAQAIRGHSSDLLLGRWWHVATMRVAYKAGELAGLGQLDGYRAMQAACAVMMGLAVVAGMALARRLTRSTAAELLFAALVIPGPMFGIYAASVMTEPMTLLMLTCMMLAWERAVHDSSWRMLWALGAGLAFGVVVDIREPAILLAAWPVISCLADRPRGRWALLGIAAGGTAVTLGAGVLMAWAWYPWNYWGHMVVWTADMARERGLFPVSLTGNLADLAKYSLAAAPVAALLTLPAVAWAAFRRRRLFWLSAATLPYIGSLLLNHDLSVNPRFVMPMMWFVAIVSSAAAAAWFVDGRKHEVARLKVSTLSAVVLGGAVIAASWGQLQHYYFDYCESEFNVYRAMLQLPDDAVVIAGPGTPVAKYLNRIGVKDFTVIASGWDWPGERLPAQIDDALAHDKRVFADLDEQDWLRNVRKSGEWDTLLDASRHYGMIKFSDAAPMVELVSSQAQPASTPATRPSGE